MKQSFYISLFLLFFSFPIFGQDYYRDIRKVSTHFMSDYLVLEVDVSVFNLAGSNILKTSGVMKKHKGAYYSKYYTTETFDDGKQTLILEHKEKEMTYFMSKDKSVKSNFNYDTQLEQLKKGIDTVIYLGTKNGITTYELKMENGLIKSAKISFTTETFILKSIQYYYNTSLPDIESDISSVIINYTRFSTDSYKSNTIDFSKYLTKSKGKYIPTSAYSSYKLSIIQ